MKVSSGDKLPVFWEEYASRQRIRIPKLIETTHGQTGTVLWMLTPDGYVPSHASGVSIAKTAETVKCSRVGGIGSGLAGRWLRQYGGNDRNWPGDLVISDTALRFTDAERLPKPSELSADSIEMHERSLLSDAPLMSTVPHSWLRLQNALTADEEFLDLIQSTSFAHTFKNLLVDGTIIHQSSGAEVYANSDRRWSDIVVHLRALGENYVDYFLGGPPRIEESKYAEDRISAIRLMADAGYTYIEHSREEPRP